MRWLLLSLVFCAIMLNYVDRQILALLKPTLEVEFGWSARDYGHLTAAFQLAAALGYLGAGWCIDRVGLRWGFALGVGIWSLAGMAHALASSVSQFITARAILGAAEAAGTPAAVKSVAVFFPASERGIALGICNTAPNLGAVLTPLLVPAFAVAFGWQTAFLVTGGLGLLWVAVWLLIDTDRDESGAVTSQAVVPGSMLLRDRRTVAVAGAKMLSDSVWWFMLFWLPDLFHQRFGLSQKTVGPPVALVYALAACGALSGGWLPAWLRARGWSLQSARQATLFAYALLVTPLPFVLAIDGKWAAAGLIGLALFAHQGFSTNLFALATDLFPASAVASAIGVTAFCGNLAGVAMSQWAAWSFDHGHGYAPLLGFAAGAYLVGALFVQLVLPVLRTREARRL